jgi:hypothetical protein
VNAKFKLIEQLLLNRMQACAKSIGEELVEAVREVNDVARDWPYFEGRTTVRRSGNAKMKVVEGSFRDNIDSGEASASITGRANGFRSTVEFEGLTGEKETTMLETKPILEVSFNEFDFERSFKDNF